MVFKLSLSFGNPAQGSNAQRGFPAPGSGAQDSGDAAPVPRSTLWTSRRPTKGARSWPEPGSPSGGQQGFPTPENGLQARPPGTMDNRAYAQSGLPVEVWTPYYDRGAAAYVQNFGKVFTNPIGAGIVAPYRTQASYGPAAQYDNGALWWTSQAIPTTVNLQGLTDPAALLAVLGTVNVQAAVRTTG